MVLKQASDKALLVGMVKTGTPLEGKIGKLVVDMVPQPTSHMTIFEVSKHS